MSIPFSTDGTSRMAARAVALRDAFDRSFADPAQPDTALKEDFVAIRVGNEALAIRLSEIAGLHVDKRLTRVPGGDSALLGIAGFRGAILPVYSLATLLGQGPAAPPRWLVIAAAASIALGFDAFDYHLRVVAESVHPREASAPDQPFVRDFVPARELVRPILHLPSILEAIRMRRPAAATR